MLEILDNSFNSIKDAEKICGGLSTPSKMPGFAFNLPATRCITGTKLVKVKGSVCEGCYALKGRYVFNTTKRAMERRYQAMMNNGDSWVWSMSYTINKRKEKQPHFRWHDSGDIQSVDHLIKIVQVCLLTPDVEHWLPTREYSIVQDYLKQYSFPANLCVRLSAHMVGGKAPKIGLPTSTVSYKRAKKNCPAPAQDNNCKDCRNCWDKSVANVNYAKH